MCVICFMILLFYCIPLVYENKTYIYQTDFTANDTHYQKYSEYQNTIHESSLHTGRKCAGVILTYAHGASLASLHVDERLVI